MFAALHLNTGNAPGMVPSTEKVQEIVNIALRTGYIQFLRVNELFHGGAFEVRVKIENNILK